MREASGPFRGVSRGRVDLHAREFEQHLVAGASVGERRLDLGALGVSSVPLASFAGSIVATGIVWFAIKATVGVRPSEEEEALGLDRAEVGVEAYPEFSAARV